MNVDEFMDLQREVVIRYDGILLPGRLAVPEGAEGVVLFAHGSGSSRMSRRNNFVAGVLHEAGIATLLFDLLMEEEALDRRNVFDIDLLASRLLLATTWLEKLSGLPPLPLGYFGASTGSAAALKASVASPVPVRAVVSPGGRPDMAAEVLDRVTAPTLLIVGGADVGVIGLNEAAYRALRCEKELRIVPGATHLFEEPGALEAVAALATEWFVRHLKGG
jgi:putative phosphoribosyl transferase